MLSLQRSFGEIAIDVNTFVLVALPDYSAGALREVGGPSGAVKIVKGYQFARACRPQRGCQVDAYYWGFSFVYIRAV
ncbi:MAG: hypothetical protein LBS53_00155 [Synergistaceae bacterium]|nr:hypothetical protein [Synergistaceae bacterium]